MRAWLNLRYTVPERRAVFIEGLTRLGYSVCEGCTTQPKRGDVLCTWNRIGSGQMAAQEFERRGLPVIVTENASWGNELAGQNWYTLARNYHNTAGMFPVGGPERWDSLGVELEPWRTSGETVVLPSRGIGANGMPRNWPAHQAGRIRPHPARSKPKPLQDDLANAGKVVTWGSGAAIKALLWGIPVESHMPHWIGTQKNTDEDRLRMFRELAWGQSSLSEIRSGEAFSRLLDGFAQ